MCDEPCLRLVVNYWCNCDVIAALGRVSRNLAGCSPALFRCQLPTTTAARTLHHSQKTFPILFFQEFPAFFIPVLMFVSGGYNQSWPALILLAMFTLHYGHRVLIYSFSIRGGKDSPITFFLGAMFFCTVNGYMQVNWNRL